MMNEAKYFKILGRLSELEKLVEVLELNIDLNDFYNNWDVLKGTANND